MNRLYSWILITPSKQQNDRTKYSTLDSNEVLVPSRCRDILGPENGALVANLPRVDRVDPSGKDWNQLP